MFVNKILLDVTGRNIYFKGEPLSVLKSILHMLLSKYLNVVKKNDRTFFRL